MGTLVQGYPLRCQTKRELDVFVDNKRLVFQQAPNHLDMRLDRMLNFKQHLEEVAGKVTSRVSLIRRLAGTTREPLHRRSQDFCLGGTRPTPPSLASVVHMFEAVAGSWRSVSAPAVSRVLSRAPERKTK